METKFWKLIEEQKPHSYKSGHWDGLMSDTILFMDRNGIYYVGVCYQGFMDGSEFCCFADQNDFEIENVTHFANIPEVY